MGEVAVTESNAFPIDPISATRGVRLFLLHPKKRERNRYRWKLKTFWRKTI